MNTRPFGIMDALTFGFSALGKNFLLILGVVVVGSLSVWGVSFLMVSLAAFYGLQIDMNEGAAAVGEIASKMPSQLSLTGDGVLLLAIGYIITYLLSSLMMMALNRIGLDIYERETSDFARLWHVAHLIGTYVLTFFLFSLMTALGFLLLIIPGVICLIKYGFADLIVIDTEHGPIESLKRSGEITDGHKWYLLGVYLLALLLFVLSIITIVGPFILGYAFIFSRIYIYRKLVEAKQKDDEQYVPVPPVL